MTPNSIHRLENILTGIAIGLLVIIAAGTFAGLKKKSMENIDAGSKSAQNLIAKGKAHSLNAPVENDETGYFELGSIRILTAADKADKGKESGGCVMVISPWLSYQKGDDIFYEELSKKRNIFKAIFSSYFARYSKRELLGKTEEKITDEILDEINARLSLGKIKSINFTDYMFFD